MYVHFNDGDGKSPLVITTPHDGGIELLGREIREQTRKWKEQGGSDPRDEGTLHIARSLLAKLASNGVVPTHGYVSLHRSHLDVNRAPDREPFAKGFDTCYNKFHRELNNAIIRAIETHGHCIYIDLHGFMNPPGDKMYDIVLGTDSHKTCPGGIDLVFAEVLRQFGGEGSDTLNYSVVFSPDAKLGVTRRYRGGWNVRSHAKLWGDRLSAIQIEMAPTIRAKSADRAKFGEQLAAALVSVMNLNLQEAK